MPGTSPVSYHLILTVITQPLLSSTGHVPRPAREVPGHHGEPDTGADLKGSQVSEGDDAGQVSARNGMKNPGPGGGGSGEKQGEARNKFRKGRGRYSCAHFIYGKAKALGNPLVWSVFAAEATRGPRPVLSPEVCSVYTDRPKLLHSPKPPFLFSLIIWPGD